MKPFVIAGVTGNTGKAAAQELLRLNHPVRVLVRQSARAQSWKSAGAEVVEVDLNDAEALTRALQNSAGAYLLNPPNHGAADPLEAAHQQGLVLAQAVRDSRLPRAVVLSSVGGHLPKGTGIVETTYRLEQTLQGLPVTFLRPSYFAENWAPLLGLVREQGILPSMLQPLDKAIPMIATRDIGLEAARILLEKDPPAVVELAGPSASPVQVAQWLSELLQKSVQAVPNPRDQWEGQLLGAGASRKGAELVAGLQDAINADRLKFQHQERTRQAETPVIEVLRGLLQGQ